MRNSGPWTIGHRFKSLLWRPFSFFGFYSHYPHPVFLWTMDTHTNKFDLYFVIFWLFFNCFVLFCFVCFVLFVLFWLFYFDLFCYQISSSDEICQVWEDVNREETSRTANATPATKLFKNQNFFVLF